MSALETLELVSRNEYLLEYPFRYCLVKGKDKIPYTLNGSKAHPDIESDFCSLEELVMCPNLDKYLGIGVSIIASNICAIDVDKCFKEPFNIETGDDRAKDILEMFKDKAYIEFSFSGKGLRILFTVDNIPNYTETYYIKNDKTKIEYYQPGNTPRYVTITGRVIFDNSLSKMTSLDTIYIFLNKYMKRPRKYVKKQINNEKTKDNDLSMETLMKKVKSLYLKDVVFQDLWFMTAEEHITKLFCNEQGKSKESNADFHLLSILYENITTEKDLLKDVFEASPYFQTKDKKHIAKWNYGNNRYFEYMYEHL